MDPGVLTPLKRPGESERKYFSRLSSFAPLPESRKRVVEVKTEDKDNIGKANKSKNIESKDKSVAQLFGAPLFHVLTTISDLELDGRHSKYRYIFYNNNIKK